MTKSQTRSAQSAQYTAARNEGEWFGKWLMLGEIIYYINNTETDLQKLLVYLNERQTELRRSKK